MKQGDWKMLGCLCSQHLVMNLPLQRMVGKQIEITGMVALWGSTVHEDMTGSAYLPSNVTMVSGTIRFRAAKVWTKIKWLVSWGPTNTLLSWQLRISEVIFKKITGKTKSTWEAFLIFRVIPNVKISLLKMAPKWCKDKCAPSHNVFFFF